MPGLQPGAWLLWVVQRGSASVLLGLFLFHVHVVHRHFLSSGCIVYDDMAAIVTRPFNKVMLLLFFLFGILHAVTGLVRIYSFFFRGSAVQKKGMVLLGTAGGIFFCLCVLIIASV
ncbi:MAG: hypothetical protein JW768_15485 [Chitinispirillaceae bacterium]|nr:hypothetical protein [Chitinispirillaceae bacterium]